MQSNSLQRVVGPSRIQKAYVTANGTMYTCPIGYQAQVIGCVMVNSDTGSIAQFHLLVDSIYQVANRLPIHTPATNIGTAIWVGRKKLLAWPDGANEILFVKQSNPNNPYLNAADFSIVESDDEELFSVQQNQSIVAAGFGTGSITLTLLETPVG